MQRLLNKEEQEKAEIFSRIKNTVPVNYGSLYAVVIELNTKLINSFLTMHDKIVIKTPREFSAF